MGKGLAPAAFQYTSGEGLAARRHAGSTPVEARERRGAVEPVGHALGLGPARRAVALVMLACGVKPNLAMIRSEAGLSWKWPAVR